MNQQSAKAAVMWFKENEPFIYRVAEKRMQMQNGLGGFDWGSMLKNIGSTVKTIATDVAPKYMEYRQQKKIMDMQIDRAKRDMPPAKIEDYVPAIQVRNDNSAETKKVIERTATKSISLNNQMMYIIGGATILGYMFFKRRR